MFMYQYLITRIQVLHKHVLCLQFSVLKNKCTISICTLYSVQMLLNKQVTNITMESFLITKKT